MSDAVQPKKWYLQKKFVAAVLTIAVAVAGAAGVQTGAVDVDALANAIAALLDAGSALVP